MSNPDIRIEPDWIESFALVRGIGKAAIVTPPEIRRIWINEVMVYCQPASDKDLIE